MVIFSATRILTLFALSFVVALIITPFIFSFLERFNLRKSNIRDEKSAPIFYQYHKDKASTPTMGGTIIWLTVLGLALVFFILGNLLDGFADYFNFVNRSETYVPLFALLFSALVGMFDDVMGILGKGPHGGGLKMRHKILLYTLVAFVGAWWFYFRLGWHTVYLPFVGSLDFGFWYFPFFIFVIVATAFSANETDGLDGLAGGVFLFSFVALDIVAFILHKYDLAAMISVIIGSLLAFLWFNIHPAKFFMGDTGSMSLGITLGIIAMLTDTSLFLPLFAFVFMIESVSVIIQTISKKIRKKKVFLSTPIHHHFQALGWPESQITMRFWIISAVTTTLGLVLFFLARFA
ncbi:phospho-N-acetylmuramoyl-pentapeptide-transferase [Patescibacteria group bacterium]|nr:phospho-N-acetylmuramoyl-pentapeptide-transferase [Patescibacteria group bacterium]